MIRLLALALLVAAPALAQHGGHHTSPYAGQERRAITSLSAEDIADLRAGRGWGLARPAELNGVPGPAHLLELAEALGLSAGQRAAIEAIFAGMRDAAIAEGARLIAAEQALDETFRSGSVTEDGLRRMLAGIERSRSALRFIHLAAHLRTPGLLTEAQIARYRALRGYGPQARHHPG